MNSRYLLKTEGARRLYDDFVQNLPIIDFHNHLSINEMQSNRRFENLTDLWITPDPYKHRLMRICGVEEFYITGNAEPYEKFEKFCEVFPYLAGNPVFDWCRMELEQVFNISLIPSKESARDIYDAVGRMLQSPEFCFNGILERFHVEYQSPVASLMDDLSPYDGIKVAPSLRGDNLLQPSAELIGQLEAITGKNISDINSYIGAVALMLDRFAEAGCSFADHSLDDGFFDGEDAEKKTEILVRLGVEYAKRGWTLLLHMDAKRKTSTCLAKMVGPAGGYAAVGGSFPVSQVCDLLNAMEQGGGLPDTVLFPLNMSDLPSLAILQGSFTGNGTPAKVQLGPAWWWNDHAFGIKNTMDCIASMGVLSQFIGMTTDSRCVLSFVRHDYFRRLICTWLDEQNAQAEWGLSYQQLGDIAIKICYENAKRRIRHG